MTDRFGKFITVISEIDKYWHKVAASVMAEYGLKGPYAIYLITLFKHPDGLNASQLSEICERNKADVSRAINDMESKGLLFKNLKNNSFYRAKLVLTQKGMSAAEKIKLTAERAVDTASSGVSPEEREILYKSLAIISYNLKTMSNKFE